MARTKPTARMPKGDDSEFGNFVRLVDRLLKVPHSKIKAEIDAEKQKTRTQKKRASVGHAYRDTD